MRADELYVETSSQRVPSDNELVESRYDLAGISLYASDGLRQETTIDGPTPFHGWSATFSETYLEYWR